MRRSVNINDTLHKMIQKTRAQFLLDFDTDFSYNDLLNMALYTYFAQYGDYERFGVDATNLVDEIFEGENPFKQLFQNIQQQLENSIKQEYDRLKKNPPLYD